MNTTNNFYESDFYAWTQEQSELLKKGAWELLDTANLVEEIESLGKQQQQELVNRLGILLGHLLKWQYQPEKRSNSWMATLREQRHKIQKLIQKNPSLKSYLVDAFSEAYEDGIDLAVQETNLPYEWFPGSCPYTQEQTLSANFFP